LDSLIAFALDCPNLTSVPMLSPQELLPVTLLRPSCHYSYLTGSHEFKLLFNSVSDQKLINDILIFKILDPDLL